MKSKITLYLLGIFMVLPMVFAQESSSHRLELSEKGPIKLTPEQAMKREKAQTAKQLGMDESQVSDFLDFQKAFGEVADTLYDKYQEHISFMWLEPMPAKIGVIQFVGEAPEEAFQLATSNKVRAGEIVILEDGRYNFDQNVERSEQAAFALQDLGYNKHATWYDPTIEKITLEMKLEQGKRKPDLNQLSIRLQERLDLAAEYSGKRLGMVSPEDFHFEILAPEVPDFQFEDPEAYGGLFLNGAGCTSAFSIKRYGGSKGILTAGHCGSIPSIVSYTGTHSMTLKRDLSNNTDKKDAEWHTSSAREIPYFRTEPGYWNLQTGWKQTSSMLGNYVCRYGQTTNFKSCGHQITHVGVTLVYPDVTYTKLARANNSTSAPGDSGGPYYSGGTAYGIHSANNGIVTHFAQIQAVKNIIGFDILTN